MIFSLWNICQICIVLAMTFAEVFGRSHQVLPKMRRESSLTQHYPQQIIRRMGHFNRTEWKIPLTVRTGNGEVLRNTKDVVNFYHRRTTQGPKASEIVYRQHSKDIHKNHRRKHSLSQKTSTSSQSHHRGKRDAAAGEESQSLGPVALDDSTLNSLVADPTALGKLHLCSLFPFKMLQCVIHCSLKANALATDSTKFLFRMSHMFLTYPQYLCPTFGSIYNKIPGIIGKHLDHNDLKNFLKELGFNVDEGNPKDQEFVQNAPNALFNNLAMFGSGPAFDIVRPILTEAEGAMNLKLAEATMFPQSYTNPVCKLAPEQGWYVSIIDAMIAHPVAADIFLRGFWVLTKALTQSLKYPVDYFFFALVESLKILTGTVCSLVSFGEHGKSFECLQPPPTVIINDAAARQQADLDLDNPYKWIVCGAHQAEIPGWTNIQKDVEGRTDTDEPKPAPEAPVEIPAMDLTAFPNPEEEVGDY